MLKHYVDDGTAIVETLKMGVKWTMPSPKGANVSDVCESPKGAAAPAATTTNTYTGGLVYKMAWEKEDKKSGLSDNQKTMR